MHDVYAHFRSLILQVVSAHYHILVSIVRMHSPDESPQFPRLWPVLAGSCAAPYPEHASPKTSKNMAHSSTKDLRPQPGGTVDGL